MSNDSSLDRQPNGLSMLDSHGHRKAIIPAEVKGRYASWKFRVHAILFLIFLGLPWLRVGGEQAVLLDLPGRHFIFFGQHLYAHDAPLIFLILLAFLSALALVTALWGRVWCGWACPQTVFIERLYRQIEIWVEGNYLERRKMQQSSGSLKSLGQRTLKWSSYLLVSAVIAHSFIAYWSGSDRLLGMMQGSPAENWSYFVWVFVMTAILAFNFGWFREQFCLIVCPYGKLQSTLLDSHTVTVMYDEARGEPRKSPSTPKDKQGDCVACGRCVQVCPTGIDIRQGIQMECIGCTACIDACDEIMQKVKKPQGLIRYKALTTKKIQWLRPRVLTYAALFIGSLIGLSVSLGFRSDVRVEILRAKDEPFILVEVAGQTQIQNHFLLRLENENQRPILVSVQMENTVGIIIPENPIRLGPGEKKDLPVIFRFSPSKLNPMGKAESHMSLHYEHSKLNKTIPLLGPFQGEK